MISFLQRNAPLIQKGFVYDLYIYKRKIKEYINIYIQPAVYSSGVYFGSTFTVRHTMVVC